MKILVISIPGTYTAEIVDTLQRGGTPALAIADLARGYLVSKQAVNMLSARGQPFMRLLPVGILSSIDRLASDIVLVGHVANLHASIKFANADLNKPGVVWEPSGSILKDLAWEKIIRLEISEEAYKARNIPDRRATALMSYYMTELRRVKTELVVDTDDQNPQDVIQRVEELMRGVDARPENKGTTGNTGEAPARATKIGGDDSAVPDPSVDGAVHTGDPGTGTLEEE